jgi:hypothetical protein
VATPSDRDSFLQAARFNEIRSPECASAIGRLGILAKLGRVQPVFSPNVFLSSRDERNPVE